jgi:ATP-binding cassette subfamily C protein
MSCVINVLALSGALYMLQVYDRVLTSQSIPTLVALSVLVVGLYVVYGILDTIRGQVLVRIGSRIDAAGMEIAYGESQRRNLDGAPPQTAIEPIRDVDVVRSFLVGPAPGALADLPWTPIFLAFVTLLSPILGLVTAGGMLVLVILAVLADLATRRLERQVGASGNGRSLELDAVRRNAEAVAAMGMGPEASARFLRHHVMLVRSQRRASDRVMLLGAVSRVVRLVLQSAILGLGAYLAIRGDVTTGAIIAASISASRAMTPVEQAISNWRAFAQARESWTRHRALMATHVPETEPLPLALPSRSLSLEGIVVRAPGSAVATLAGVSLALKAGQGLAVVGASGSGKSTLVRAMAGVWPSAHGVVRLDGAPLDRWDRAERGRFIGYMPQHVELFPTTVTANIARLDESPDSAAVVAAAHAAGIHEVIVNLPQGYETVITGGGAPLSAGQRQQVGLARALYGDPFLVLLDEPNANLDQDGEDALIAALQAVRARGGIAVVVAHRRSILAALDTLAVVERGRLEHYGPKAEVLKALAPRIDAARSRAIP